MSEIIKFNTEDYSNRIQTVDILSLVDENDEILLKNTPIFDFENPPTDPVKLASMLVETCKHHRAYGLAANQCGLDYRVFVMGSDDEYVAFFNPVLISQSIEENILTEACLSFPKLALKVSRPSKVVVEYQDFKGEKHTIELHNFSAHVVQHELDHLNGIVYTQRTKPMALKMGIKKRNKFNKLIDRYEAANKKMASIR